MPTEPPLRLRTLRAGADLVAQGILDLIYPPRCLVCGAWQEEAFCEVCQRDIRPVPPPLCDRCGTPVPAGRLVCSHCEAGPEPAFAWSQTLGQYDGTLRTAIHRLKYNGKTALAKPLGRLLAASLDQPPTPLLFATGEDEPLPFDCVAPIPLHPSRLRQRGFNQAERIARVLAEARGWPLDTRGLLRIRRTRSQTELSLEARAANVHGAFMARSSTYFAGQRVLLIDDVLTTTSTMQECARIVREAGATRVCVIGLARGL